MIIAAIGGRTVDDYELLSNTLNKYTISELVSGGCSGGDKMVERYAKENNIHITIFKANWKKYGRAAGPIRNTKIIESCDCVVALWDGKSKGTGDSINKAKKLNLEINIVEV